MKPMADLPPITIPPLTANVECFEEAARKSLLATMMRPEAIAALKEGLTCTDLRERRMWWDMVFKYGIIGGVPGEGDNAVTKVIFQNFVPAPAHEDGPVGKPVASLPEKIAERRR